MPSPINVNLRTRQRYANHRRAWELASMTPTEWYRSLLDAATVGGGAVESPPRHKARIRAGDGKAVTIRPPDEPTLKRWQAAAEAADMPLTTWIATMGDVAAGGALAEQVDRLRGAL